MKESNLDFLIAVCERMQQVGLVSSKGQFSRVYLGRGSSYLTSMAARDRQVPDRIIEYLRGEIEDAIAATQVVSVPRVEKHLRELMHFTVIHQNAARGEPEAIRTTVPATASKPQPVSYWTAAASAIGLSRLTHRQPKADLS